jgi:hypothetical protein
MVMVHAEFAVGAEHATCHHVAGTLNGEPIHVQLWLTKTACDGEPSPGQLMVPQLVTSTGPADTTAPPLLLIMLPMPVELELGA